MLWVRSIFAPIERITENIRRITDNDGYNSISYKKKDEFFPLISAINNLHKSLSIQEKIRSNFLTDLSHEIRTPITAVKCYLEAIEDDVIKLDTKTFGLFQKELDRLITTTEEILYFDQTTNPLERQIHVERLSIKQIVTPLIQEYIPQCQKNNQQIHVEIPKDAIIRMDPSMLSQIIHNIFSNFIKYAGSHSTLTCYYRKDEQYTTIIFIDNGK
jgi:two-component system sensor histidine kinase BaeS